MLIIAPLGTYYNVVWTPDSNISSINSQSPTVAPKTTTTYSVAAVDSNNCSVSGSINVTVTANTQNDFIMPTAFSPNGDGVNDLFKAILRNGATVTMFHIYNRWGELIYDKDRDNSDGWEGLYKNVAQPIGVYVYFISVKSVSGKVVTQEGNLTLLR
jgi:gliding motility-associated-like protein